MKKAPLALLVPAVGLSIFALRGQASGQPYTTTTTVTVPTSTTATPPPQTTIKGTLGTSLALPSGSLAGFQCSNLVVTATSKEVVAPAAGTVDPVPVPKWTRTAHATGTWPSCSYSLRVQGGSSFGLQVGASTAINCGSIEVAITPAQSFQSVPVSTTKTSNLTLTRLTCTAG